MSRPQPWRTARAVADRDLDKPVGVKCARAVVTVQKPVATERFPGHRGHVRWPARRDKTPLRTTSHLPEEIL